MNPGGDRLYDLLPVIYRRRDAEQGFPLRALLRVIAEQVNVVQADIGQLYENWFIETCQDWVVPYVGDLLGYEPVHEAGEPGDVATSEGRQRNRILIPRREVANTIRYRRRKGTWALLELLANDVAGWPARAVEFYTLVARTQTGIDIRTTRSRTVDLHASVPLTLLDGPFDTIAHTVDVRRVDSSRTPGRYNVPSVGLFVWRLQPYSVAHTPAYCHEDVGPHCFTFNALGNDTPLFAQPRPEPGPSHIAETENLPVPVTRHALAANLSAYYGTGRSLQIWETEPHRPIPPHEIVVADLEDWHYRPPAGKVAVDPERGRIAFPHRHYPQKGAWVSYHYGFSADIGGGEYDRPLSQPTELLVLGDDDVTDINSLAKELRAAKSAFALALREQLSPAAQAAVNQHTDETMRHIVIPDINRVLRSPSLGRASLNGGDLLPDVLVPLIESEPEGQDLLRLNRILLEYLFKGVIARSFGLYRVGEGQEFAHLRDAITQWCTDRPRNAVIEIMDSGIFVDQIDIKLKPNQQLQLRAANGKRPIIRLLDWHAEQADALTVSGQRGSRFTLDGVLITGRGVHLSGKLAEATIRHCTLVPGWALHHDCSPRRPAEASLFLSDTGARVSVEHSIIGSVQVSEDEVRTDPVRIHLSDTILDATSCEREAVGAPGCAVAHAHLTIQRCTVIGQVQVHAIDLAENSIFDGLVTVARRQIGCMRFCYITPDSRTPRRYECQPALAEAAVADELPCASDAEVAAAKQRERTRVRPSFTSLRYGTPGYCQLARICADEIKRGADDESEMGAFHDLFQPQREANLRARLAEYTPAGTDAGIIYVD